MVNTDDKEFYDRVKRNGKRIQNALNKLKQNDRTAKSTTKNDRKGKKDQKSRSKFKSIDKAGFHIDAAF